MASVNQVNLLGNVCFDIELRDAGGTSVCDLRMAVNERVKRGDEWVEEPVYVDVTCWGRTAEIAEQYLEKGSACHIEGRLKLDQWEDQEGNQRQKLKVVCNKLTLLGRSNGDGSSSSSATTAPAMESVPF
jgi:single-strand DNA-binding protein